MLLRYEVPLAILAVIGAVAIVLFGVKYGSFEFRGILEWLVPRLKRAEESRSAIEVIGNVVYVRGDTIPGPDDPVVHRLLDEIEHLVSSGYEEVILDFSDARFIASRMLGTILEVSRQASVTVIHTSEQIADLRLIYRNPTDYPRIHLIQTGSRSP